MPTYRHESLERLLDRCIDRLVGGATWNDLLPEEAGDRAELQQLMAVAELLREAGGDVKPIEPARRERLSRALAHAGVRFARLLFPTGAGAPRLALAPRLTG